MNLSLIHIYLFDGVRMINSLVAGNEKIDAGNLAKLKKLYHRFFPYGVQIGKRSDF